MSLRVRFAVALTDVAEFLADKAEDILQGTAASAFNKVDETKAATVARAEAAKQRAIALEEQAERDAAANLAKVNAALAKRPYMTR